MTDSDDNDNEGTGGETGDGNQTSTTSGDTILKEIITTAIAVVVTGLTVWMLIVTFNEAGEKVSVETASFTKSAGYEENERLRLQRKSDQKDILLLTLGLFGTVLGYYFGRVPAERRAERAENTADEAEAAARDAIETSTMAQQQQMLEELGRTEAEAKLLDAMETNESVMEMLKPGMQQARATLSGGGQVAAGTAESVAAVQQLEALGKRLKRRST